ncbi:Crp/Fnr family transcriptional regulator [Tepidamorphus sp. 3E244]|uniref:Crp/Fnr family transcriptional regulator n=1 Tax=Tepidamorphus sp. 3E244 TaxID=3385498 RepID=UPI0038FD08CA
MIGSDAELLRPLPVFEHFGDEMLKLIAFSAIRESFPAGKVIFNEGDPATTGMLVVEGSVLMTETIDGEEVERAIYGPGSLIGELALLTPTYRPATAIARADARFLVIARELMHRVLAEYPDVAIKLQGYLQHRLSNLNEDLQASAIHVGMQGESLN